MSSSAARSCPARTPRHLPGSEWGAAVKWPLENAPPLREEVHFGDRRVTCFSTRPKSLDHMLRDSVARNGGGDAIIDGDVRMSYRDFDAAVTRAAANLAEIGIAKGDRVALVMGNCAEFLITLMAAARIAAISVPINAREQTPELTYILNHCGARVVVHDTAVVERLPLLGDVETVEHRFCVSGTAPESASFDDLLKDTVSDVPERRSEEEDVAVILYTSGTTGRPKGAMLTHFNIAHSVMHFEICMGLSEADRSILAVPASHVTGLVANILAMIHVAGCNVVLPQFDAANYLELASRERVTHTILVPAMYNLCLLRADLERCDLSAWRIGGYGGAPMPEATIAALAEKLPQLVLMNAYGSTEVTSPATLMPIGGTAERPDSVGITLPCGDIKVMDPDGREVVRGEDGEIWIAGPNVVPGYWDDAEKTVAAFEDGYWKSGDIGSMDADGYLRIGDRIKDMIIRGGYNIYSAELENVLNHHPGVIEVAAVGRADPVLGEKTHVFVRAASGDVAADDLRIFCAKRLADYKVPDFVTFIDELLPRNANGKILKNTLREWAAKE